MIGAFYEIGSQGALSSYLASPDWKNASPKRILVPEEYQSGIESWKCYIVEPLLENMPPIIELSRKNFDIVPVQCAIGDVDRSLDEFRVIDLRTNPTWGEPHLGLTGQVSEAYTRVNFECDWRYSVQVPVLSLDSLFSVTDSPPTVLRLSVEGAELPILSEYSFDSLPRLIQVKCHGSREALTDILESHGYPLNFDEESDEILAGLCGYGEDF